MNDPKPRAAATNRRSTWDDEIGALLSDLSSAQSDLLTLLGKKREHIAARDAAALESLQPEETHLSDRLMSCHRRRQQLLATAGEEGLPSDSLRSLTASLPRQQRERLQPEVSSAQRRARLLQHQSLTNWVLVQRSLLHLSQMVEIIATGGKMQPTYGQEPSATTGGAIVDQAV